MSIASGVGSFGLTPQWAKGQAATAGKNFMKAHSVGVAPQQDTRILDPEIGGSLLPSHAFKAGVRVAGGVSITPRADDLGWLLYALCGACASTGDATNGYTHDFTMDTDESVTPWASLYKNVGKTIWETYQDCKLATARLNMDAASALRIDATWLGISNSLVDSDPSWGETYSEEPIFITCSGHVELPNGTEITAQSAVIDVTNDISDDEEVIIGSYYLDDPIILSRRVTITITYKWQDADLYRQIYMGGVSGTEWDATTYFSDVDIQVESAEMVGVAASDPYHLQFTADNVMWAMDPVTMAGNNILVANLVGTIMYDASNSFMFTLLNEKSAYSWT